MLAAEMLVVPEYRATGLFEISHHNVAFFGLAGLGTDSIKSAARLKAAVESPTYQPVHLQSAMRLANWL